MGRGAGRRGRPFKVEKRLEKKGTVSFEGLKIRPMTSQDGTGSVTNCSYTRDNVEKSSTDREPEICEENFAPEETSTAGRKSALQEDHSVREASQRLAGPDKF